MQSFQAIVSLDIGRTSKSISRREKSSVREERLLTDTCVAINSFGKGEGGQKKSEERTIESGWRHLSKQRTLLSLNSRLPPTLFPYDCETLRPTLPAIIRPGRRLHQTLREFSFSVFHLFPSPRFHVCRPQ